MKKKTKPVYHTIVQVDPQLSGYFVPQRGNRVLVQPVPTSNTKYTLVNGDDKVTSRAQLPLFTQQPQHSTHVVTNLSRYHLRFIEFELLCYKQNLDLHKEKPQGKPCDCPSPKVDTTKNLAEPDLT